MAPVEDAKTFSQYLDEDVQQMFTKYDKLLQEENPEENPYKSMYEARKLLESTLEEVQRRLGNVKDGSDEINVGREMVARLMLYLGKNHYICEEVPTAERFFNRSLERYLRLPSRLQPKEFVHIQDVLNHLGMLWCNRQGHGEGMNFLRRAQLMYLNRPEEVRTTCDQQAEEKYTLTMFYLAQAYGALNKPTLSARFCAKTMSQQLEHNTSGRRPKEMVEKDPFDCKDWVRNCCSLSDFFAGECMFWTAEYLLHAAKVMCERCVEICGFKPEGIDDLKCECERDLGTLYSTRLKFTKTCTENPELGEHVWRGERKRNTAKDDESEPAEGSRLTFRCSADGGEERPPEGGEGPIFWDATFPEVVFLEDEEAQDNRFTEETIEKSSGPVSPDEPQGDGILASGFLDLGNDIRVRLPVYFKQLHMHAQRRIVRANAPFLSLRTSGGPDGQSGSSNKEGTSVDNLADSSKASTSEKFPSCAATNFEAVREIFKLANYYMGRALSHFLLDGWVTEHVRILQEMSQIYRTLLYWETNHQRWAAMMTRRVRMLAPLLDVLNPKVYIAFWRQLSLEVAEVLQELYEFKVYKKVPGSQNVTAVGDNDEDEEADTALAVKRAARCNDVARRSIKYYDMFTASYQKDGQDPERIEDENARTYLTVRLNRARIRTKMLGTSLDEQIEANTQALREYEWILDYAKRHPEICTKPDIDMGKEMELCAEMVKMLPSNLSKLAAQRNR